MKKINIYLFVVLLLFFHNALAADNWSDDYCVTYKTLQRWYTLADAAHRGGDSVTALKYYYPLQLLGFGKGSVEKPWPEIKKLIDRRIIINYTNLMKRKSEKVERRTSKIKIQKTE